MKHFHKLDATRINGNDGSYSILTYKWLPNDKVKVNNSFYGADGYYRADKSFDTELTREALESELDAAEKLIITGRLKSITNSLRWFQDEAGKWHTILDTTNQAELGITTKINQNGREFKNY